MKLLTLAALLSLIGAPALSAEYVFERGGGGLFDLTSASDKPTTLTVVVDRGWGGPLVVVRPDATSLILSSRTTGAEQYGDAWDVMGGGQDITLAYVDVYRAMGDGSWSQDVLPEEEAIRNAIAADGLTPEIIARIQKEKEPGVRSIALIPVPEAGFAEIRAAASEERGDQALASLKAMRERHPEALFLRLAEMDILFLKKDDEALKIALATEEASFAASGNPVLQSAAQYYGIWLNDQTRDQVALQLPGEDDISSVARVQREISLMNRLERRRVPLLFGWWSARYLETQTAAKVLRTEGMFDLLAGDAESGIDKMQRVVLLGMALIEVEPDSIGGTVGVGPAGFGISGLTVGYMNAWDSAAELEEQWPALDRLWTRIDKVMRGPRGWEEPLRLSHSYGYQLLTQGEIAEEAETRLRNLHTRATLLRDAVAVRHHLMATGDFPTSEENLGRLLPNGTTADPFSKQNGRIRLKVSADEAVVYSVGPDGVDDGGALEYDPINGTFTRGDLMLKIPRKRQHAFPSKPVPETVDQILDRYPNGLPADAFADTRGASLALSRTNPPMVWSLGPDVDEQRMVLGTYDSRSAVPADQAVARRNASQWQGMINQPDQPSYDPTNGAISEGNLYRTLPAP